ncbi:hypothetical protein CVT25_014061 [Psilocybe cyanescens]|uniref:Uncharacterized protein n=1 Tax=Psilocybe cyanescens TaxID=93625 RepID=A0A409X1Y0_PSICY|nr:hypothetical protein CVT25_014061 [Psilocybe cyanescens]
MAYNRKRRSLAQSSSSKEASTAKDIDQGALEAGNTTSRKSASGIFGAIQAEPTPHRKGVCFLSTSTNAEGDTPVILPWRVDSDIYDDKVPKHVHEHSASQDISSCGRSTYDDISLFGLSFLFDSEDDSYDADDSSCEFLQADLHEVSLNDDLSPPWAEPVDSKWKNEVATAMNAFRSSRVDHDDIVAFPVHVESEGLSQQIAGGSKEIYVHFGVGPMQICPVDSPQLSASFVTV